MRQTGNVRTIAGIGLGLALAACNGSSNDPAPAAAIQSPTPPVTVVDAEGNTSFDAGTLDDVLVTLPVDTIDAAEEAGLVYMREEEKLAHDVYTQLGALWMENVFTNIARSEQTHTDAVLTLLDRYQIADPVGANPVGIFVDPSLQGLHDVLVARGTASLVDALYVGAEIEEIDLIDIAARLEDVVGNDDIVLVYENLMKGSRNHLRAFVRVLAREYVTYEPQYLSRDEYDAIIDNPTESGPN